MAIKITDADPHTIELISAYMDGELRAEEAVHVEALLAARPDLAQRVQEYRDLDRLLIERYRDLDDSCETAV